MVGIGLPPALWGCPLGETYSHQTFFAVFERNPQYDQVGQGNTAKHPRFWAISSDWTCTAALFGLLHLGSSLP